MNKFDMGEMVFAATGHLSGAFRNRRGKITRRADRLPAGRTSDYSLNVQARSAILTRSAPVAVSRKTVSPAAGSVTTPSKRPLRT
jgi:hypothetical protein